MNSLKKLSSRERKLLSVIVIGLLLYVLYTNVLTPLQAKKGELSDEITKLQAEAKDINGLEVSLESVKSQSSDLQEEIVKMDAQKGFGVMDYQELLTYMGESALNYEVDIVNFKRLPFEDKDNYWEIPFHISVQGEYRDLILFVDSLYQIEEYFAIRDLSLKQITLTPMTEEVEGEEEETDSSRFSWLPGFVEQLDRNLPSEIGLEIEGVEGESYSKYIDQVKGLNETKEKIELTFSFHFISLEENPENMKLE